MAQIGLLPSNQEREGLPITGAEQARKLLELSGHARGRDESGSKNRRRTRPTEGKKVGRS